MDFRIRMDDAAWDRLSGVNEEERNRLVREIHDLARDKSIGPSERGSHTFIAHQRAWTVDFHWDSEARVLHVPAVRSLHEART